MKSPQPATHERRWQALPPTYYETIVMHCQRRAGILALLLTCSASSARWTVAVAGGLQNENAIADVKAGRVDTARASWWGIDPDDATQSLQAAMNFRAKRVIVEDMGWPWIVRTIELPSDKECEDVTIDGLLLLESGGDGVYLGIGADRATNRNVRIRNVVCDGNNRQGISVITAENLLIENCVFRNTQGTAPQAGIDFEPNHPEERLVNCVLRNCRSENNVGHAYHIYLGHMHEQSPPISIRFENCSSKGCQRRRSGRRVPANARGAVGLWGDTK